MSFLAPRNENVALFLHAVARSGGDLVTAYENVARDTKGTLAAAAIQRAIAATSDGSSWAAELGALGRISKEFLSPVLERSVLGQVGRPIPGRTRVFAPGSGVTSAWTGEGQPVQVSQLTLAEDAVALHKVTAMLVAANSFLEQNAPEVHSFLVDALTAESVRTLNKALLDPANAGSDAMPQSITHTAPTTAVTGGYGSDAAIASLRSDFRRLFSLYSGSWTRAALVMSTRSAASLSMSQVLYGVADFIPVVVGDVCGDGASPELDQIVLLDRDSLRYAVPDVVIDASRNGNLVLSGAGPDTTTPSPKSTVSLFQSSATALKATITTGWNVPPAGYVAVLSGLPRE